MDISRHISLLMESYHNHFRETLNRFNVKKLKHLNREDKKRFFHHLKTTWRSRKNSPLK